MLAEVYFNLPLLSAVLLLIAGILLGFALWIPFRGDSATTSGQLPDVLPANQELATALREQREAYAGLERKHSQICDQLAALSQSSQRTGDAERELESSRQVVALARQSLDELKATTSSQLAEERRLRAALEAELAENRLSSAQALDDERRLRQDAVLSLQQAQQQLAQQWEQAHAGESDAPHPRTQDEQLVGSLQALKIDYDDLQARYEALLDELVTSRRAQGDAESELSRLRQTTLEKSQAALVSQQLTDNYAKLKDELIRRVQTLEAELSRHDSDQRTWADRCAAMEKQYQELARQKSRLEVMYDEALLGCDELIETVDSQRRTIQQLQTALDSQAQALDSGTATASEVMELRDQLHCTQRALDQARAELSDLLTRHHRLTHERDHAVANQALLAEDLQHHQRALEAIGRSHEKTASQAARLEHQQVELEQLVRDHEHTIETLRTNVIDLHDIQHKCVSLQCTIRDQAAELDSVRIDRDEVARQLAAEKTQREQARASIGNYEQAMDSLRAQREELLESLKCERSRNDELTSVVDDQAYRLELASQHSCASESLPQRVEHLQHTNLQLAAEVATLAAERDAAHLRATESSDLLERLRGQLASSHQSILALERDRDEAIAQLRRHHVQTESQLSGTVFGPLAPIEDAASEPEDDRLKRVGLGRPNLASQTPSDEKAA